MDSNVYELFGIVIHSGMTSGSGHYETYVRLCKDTDSNYEQINTVTSIGDVQNLKESKANANGSCFEENEVCSKNHVVSNGVDDALKTDINGNCVFDDERKPKLNGKSKRKRSRKSENGNMKIENGAEIPEKSPESSKEAKRKKVGDDTCSSVEGAESPLKQIGQGQTSCMSVITRYFQRSRKVSSKDRPEKSSKTRTNTESNENSSNADENIDKLKENGSEVKKDEEKLSEPASNEKPKGHRSIENYFKKTTRKSHGKNVPKSPAIRKLHFQGNSEETSMCNGNSDSHKETLTSEGQSSSSDEESQTSDGFGARDEILKTGWVHFDDCTVASLSKQDVVSILSSADSSFTSPYLLFYRKIEFKKE